MNANSAHADAGNSTPKSIRLNLKNLRRKAIGDSTKSEFSGGTSVLDYEIGRGWRTACGGLDSSRGLLASVQAP